jgi:hypothetical protein
MHALGLQEGAWAANFRGLVMSLDVCIEMKWESDCSTTRLAAVLFTLMWVVAIYTVVSHYVHASLEHQHNVTSIDCCY